MFDTMYQFIIRIGHIEMGNKESYWSGLRHTIGSTYYIHIYGNHGDEQH